MRRVGCLLLVLALAAVVTDPAAAALRSYQVAGLQIALYRYGHYNGRIDGVAGPRTTEAIRKLQRAAGIKPDGVVGKRTRAALGKFGRPGFGSRVLKRGMFGFDVSVLQFLLAKRGFPTEALNSRFGPVTERMVRRFQRRAGLAADGVVGRETRAALLLGRSRRTPKTAKTAKPKQKPKPKPKGTAKRKETRTRGGGGSVVRVRPGETLTLIAARHGTSIDELARRNRIDPSRVLLIGTRLVVPGVAPTSRLAVERSLDRWAAHYGIARELARALAWQESGFQPHVRSAAGAEGVMQVTRPTWSFVELFVIGRQIPRTPDGNVRVGVAYLAHLLEQFRGDLRLAVGAYYQGPAGVRRDGLWPVTERFVANVLALRGRV